MATRGKNTKMQEVAKAVHAGKPMGLETVDFSNPHRPKTCLEVDFPILPVNRVASIEINASKPIYQVSKWWARRCSSVFRSLLIAAALKAPDDDTESAKTVWDAYYGNHQKKGSFSNLKVADIFMGGGTTIVEGSRLGMKMYGTDLSPVAWFIVKNELADVKREEVEALLADVKATLKPQVMPFYACNCPRGHRGVWKREKDGKTMEKNFDPLTLSVEERKQFSYHGPEIIYVFWAKHGPCQVTGCGHRTPIMSSPVVAVKTISVKAWPYKCRRCKKPFDIEEREVRMAPGAPLVLSKEEPPFVTFAPNLPVICPHCEHKERQLNRTSLSVKKKKVSLTLLVHPEWLKGSSSSSVSGTEFGGRATDDFQTTADWHQIRAETLRLIEVRGPLPKEIQCPETGATLPTGNTGGTVPKKSHYACGACGTVQDIRKTIKATGKTGPMAPYVLQGYCPTCDIKDKQAYGGRFFMPIHDSKPYDMALKEWEHRRHGDLANFWPQSEIPYGLRTHKTDGIPDHGYTHWWTLFNARQLLFHSQLLRSIIEEGKGHRWEIRECVLSAFQNYLRNQNLFCIWNLQRDTLEPMLSNPNFAPKATVIENNIFHKLGRGNWTSCSESLLKAIDWVENPWDLVSKRGLAHSFPQLAEELKGKSQKVFPRDSIRSDSTHLHCGSSTKLDHIDDESMDLVITDPPFGNNLHYSELSDFFYVWLRLALKDKHPKHFKAEYTPKTLEVVANRARHENPDSFYQRLLTECWHEAHRILKPGGILAFTFHHSQDAPWVTVLESLFSAGFYLEATYPIRSDEIKGGGAFGSQKIEYDIVHVCRKRSEETHSCKLGKNASAGPYRCSTAPISP